VGGLKRVYERWRHRFYTWYCERKFGVSTMGFIQPRDLGIENPDSMAHSPLGYEFIFWALQAIPFAPADVVFLDYGSGKGRVLAAAAAHPFRRVIGVELSPLLVEIARQNLAQMKRRRAAAVEVHCGDAAKFELPADVNVIFLFNPFAGGTLTEVVDRMERSFSSHPRDLFVISFNHDEFDLRVRGRAWLKKVHETSLSGLYRAMPPPPSNC
jgi:SAM-dependent methyltransferase